MTTRAQWSLHVSFMLYDDVVHDVDMMMMMHDNKIMWDVWWSNDLTWWCSTLRWCIYIKCHDALWRRVYKDTTLINVNDDEYMKVNACILFRVMCEWCIGLCHKDDLTMKTLCILCAHKHRVTSPFMMMSTDAYAIMLMPCMTLKDLLIFGRRYGQLTRLWWVQGVRIAWGSTLARVGRV